jgi:hypothetical protein
MAFKMKGSPAKMGSIQGTAGHTSALKKLADKPPVYDPPKRDTKKKPDFPTPDGMKRGPMSPEQKAKIEKRMAEIGKQKGKASPTKWTKKHKKDVKEGKKTSTIDKVKSAGKAVWDTLKQEWRNPAGHGSYDSTSHRYSRHYKKNKAAKRAEQAKKNSPAKLNWDDVKKGAKKIATKAKRAGEAVYDKASQVGMGLKEGAKARDRNTQKGIGSQNLENVWDVTKKAYNKEKKADKAMRRAEKVKRQTPKAKKEKGPSRKDAMESVKNMKRRQDVIKKDKRMKITD